jgi:hypothetical protein
VRVLSFWGLTAFLVDGDRLQDWRLFDLRRAHFWCADARQLVVDLWWDVVFGGPLFWLGEMGDERLDERGAGGFGGFDRGFVAEVAEGLATRSVERLSGRPWRRDARGDSRRRGLQ